MLKFLETVWLVIAFGGAVMTAYSFFDPRFENYDKMWFAVITAVAAGYYYIRRRQRLSMEKKQGKI